MRAVLLLALAACAPEGGGADNSGSGKTTAPTLPDPDLTGTEAGTFVTALNRALAFHAGVPFDGHRTTLDEGSAGCPDHYLGELEDPDVDGGAVSWVDFCQTTDGRAYEGHVRWEGAIVVEGHMDDPAGRQTDADRELSGNATVKDGDALRFEFVGEAEESYAINEDATGYQRWTWSSTVDATLGGSAIIDPSGPTPDGWRTDLTLQATGGTEDSLAIAGNAYWFGPHLAGRFDSVDMDLEIVAPNAAGPDTCLEEPRGHLSIRDGDAVWYDLVFMPRTSEDLEGDPWPNDPLSLCDGCGTLYVRGVAVGEVCPDLMQVLDGRIQPPELAEFVMPLRRQP